MQDWVELKSWVDDDEMRELYSTATVLAMPSFADGFSLPALEAMMAGLPVMISDIAVYREVVGDVALFIDPNDLGSIAAAMTTAATRPDLLAELTARGYERAALFSWERTARGTLASFERPSPKDDEPCSRIAALDAEGPRVQRSAQPAATRSIVSATRSIPSRTG